MAPLTSSKSDQIVYRDGSKGAIKPSQDFNFVSLDARDKNQTLYLGAHFEPKPGSREPYQYYHRLSGLTNDGRNLAIDIDTDHRKWRQLHLSGPDTGNKWLAQLSNTAEPGRSRLPLLTKVTQTLIRNGSFSYGDKPPQHIYIPELELMIGNAHEFARRCEYEPFIRVYNTQGLNQDEMRQLGDQPWSSDSEDRVVMRSASFGHGRKRLDMCLREGPILPQIRAYTDKNAVADELLVPFGIISALRLRVWESAKRKFSC